MSLVSLAVAAVTICKALRGLSTRIIQINNPRAKAAKQLAVAFDALIADAEAKEHTPSATNDRSQVVRPVVPALTPGVVLSMHWSVSTVLLGCEVPLLENALHRVEQVRVLYGTAKAVAARALAPDDCILGGVAARGPAVFDLVTGD